MQVSTNKSQANFQGIKPLSSRKLKRFLPTGYQNSTYQNVYPPNMEISRSRSSLSHSLQIKIALTQLRYQFLFYYKKELLSFFQTAQTFKKISSKINWSRLVFIHYLIIGIEFTQRTILGGIQRCQQHRMNALVLFSGMGSSQGQNSSKFN